MSTLAGYAPHAALTLFLVLVHLWPQPALPSVELARAPLGADLFDLHVLASRGEPDPEPFGQDFVTALLDEDLPSPRREYVYTNDVCKFHFPRAQLEHLLEGARGPLTPAWWLGFLFQFRKTGGVPVGAAGPLSRRELEWTFDALAGRPLPEAALRQHCLDILLRTRSYLAGLPAQGD